MKMPDKTDHSLGQDKLSAGWPRAEDGFSQKDNSGFEDKGVYHPWLTGSSGEPMEIMFAWNLNVDPEYRTKQAGRNLGKIAHTLNEEFHGGKPIRDEDSVHSKLSAYKRSLPADEASKEDRLRAELLGYDFQNAPHLLKSSPSRVNWVLTEETEQYHKFSEEHYVWMAASCPKYMDSSGKPDLEKIADKINETFHGGNPVRKASTVKRRLIYYQKSLERKHLADQGEEEPGLPEPYSRMPLRYRIVLVSLNYRIKSGIHNELGVPVSTLLHDLTIDPEERSLKLSPAYICNMFKDGLLLDKEYPSNEDSGTFGHPSIKDLFGYELKLSEDELYIKWSPSLDEASAGSSLESFVNGSGRQHGIEK